MPAQIRAARALLGWTRPDLAAAAGVSPRTVASMELGDRPGHRTKSVEAVIAALERAGVELLPDGGVRPRTKNGAPQV